MNNIFFLLFLFFMVNLILLVLVFDYFILLLIFLDLLLLVNILFLVLFTILSGSAVGYIYALLILAVAAADTAVGLALFIIYFRFTGKTTIT